jgi:hypothetical protein
MLPEDYKGPKGVLWAENKVVDFENGGQISSHLTMLWKKIFG